MADEPPGPQYLQLLANDKVETLGAGARRRSEQRHLPLRLGGLWSLGGRLMANWEPQIRKRVRRATRELGTVLARELHPFCMHVKGHGGVKGAVQLIQRILPRVQFVGRFDVASYYRSIRHDLLVAQLRAARVPERLRALIDDYLRLPDTRATGRGLVAGGGLSPLLGALHLLDVDRALGNKRLRGRGVYYLRYMDDILILTRTRWQLRHAIATLRRMLGKLDLALHRDKRFIGRTSAGFDFLGYRFQPGRRLRPAMQSLERLVTRSRRLYEQGATRARLWRYLQRWVDWLWGGLGGTVSRQGGRRTYWIYILERLAIPKPACPGRASQPAAVEDGTGLRRSGIA
jgi:RNA-directed DNA polymerase